MQDNMLELGNGRKSTNSGYPMRKVRTTVQVTTPNLSGGSIFAETGLLPGAQILHRIFSIKHQLWW